MFRSKDRGRTWNKVAQISGSTWSALFVHCGKLYLFGYAKKGGPTVVRLSDDEGRTWTTPRNADTGVIFPSGGGTPNPPVVYNGRRWIASGTRAWSFALRADPLAQAPQRLVMAARQLHVLVRGISRRLASDGCAGPPQNQGLAQDGASALPRPGRQVAVRSRQRLRHAPRTRGNAEARPCVRDGC